MEKTETNFFRKRKWHIPRKYIVVSKRLCDREFKKLRQWLDDKDRIEIGTDSEKRIWILNMTKIEQHKFRKATMGKDVKIPATLYEKLSHIAEQKGISVNEVANQLLETAMN